MISHDPKGEQTSPPTARASWYAQGLSDGLGDRLLMFDNSAGPSLELLRFRRDLAEIPGFEEALREQVDRLSRFRHPAFAQVRSVQRLEPDDDLALISNCTPGKRLSEVLHQARGPAFAANVIRQLAPALALLQQHDAGSAHGMLNADRIVVTPEGRLTIIEHVVGPALESLGLSLEQLSAMGIDVPPTPDGATPRLDAAADWYQLGIVAASVLLGRPVTPGDLPQVEHLLDRLEDSPAGDDTPLSPVIRQWLERALRISGDRIETAAAAGDALEELLPKAQPRGARAIEPVRHVPEVSPDSAPVTPAPAPRAAATPAPAAVVPPTPAAVAPSAPAAVAPPARTERTMFTSSSVAVPPPPLPQTRPQQSSGISAYEREAFEREALAGKHRLLELEQRTALAQARTATESRPQPAARRSLSNSVLAALVMIVAVEAGVIAWLAHTLWLAPRPPVMVESTSSGEQVRVSSASIGAVPLSLAVAPDLQWVRVTTASPDAIPGAKKARTAAGAVRISSPIALKVFEGSRVLGSVPGADLELAAGRHEIALVNEALGYRLEQGLDVGAGETVAIHVTPRPGLVTIDASPWAEVSIDGQPVGRTPLGPLPLTPGEHQFTFQHPAGGRDRQRVTIKSEANVRVVGVLGR